MSVFHWAHVRCPALTEHVPTKAQPTNPRETTTMTVYGLIEWRDSLNPTLVVGDSEQAVKHTAAQVIIAWDEDNTLPWLGFNPTSDEVDVWLEKVADMDCEPFFNIVAPADVVTADPVEVNNQEFNV